MIDLMFILVIVGFFAGAIAYVEGCERLGVRPSNPDRADESSAKHRARKIPTNTRAVFRGILRARGAGDRLSGDGSDYSDGLLGQ